MALIFQIAMGVLFGAISFGILVSDDDDAKVIVIGLWVIGIVLAIAMK